MISIHGAILFGYLISEKEFNKAIKLCDKDAVSLPDNWSSYFIKTANEDYFLGVLCATVSRHEYSLPVSEINCSSEQGTILSQLFTQYIEPYTDNIYLPQFWLTCLDL